MRLAYPVTLHRASKECSDYEWFREVELIVQRKVGMEPVNYVRNIFKYYLAFRRIRDRAAERESAKRELKDQPVGAGEPRTQGGR